MTRKTGRFRLTIRARITLSVALLIALGGGALVAGLNVFMRFGPVWAIESLPTAPAVPNSGADTLDIELYGEGEAWLPDAASAVPALEIRDASDVFGTLLWSSIVALVAIVALGAVAAWVLAGRLLAPLQDINEAARAASPTQLDRRVALVGPRDELTDLSDTLDDMLDRLERAFRAQQLFAANAAHELRTPLATEKAMLDMLLDGPEPTKAEYRVVAERLREVNRRSIAMGEALLELTRAQTAGVKPGEGAAAAHDVSELLADPLARGEELAGARGQRITTEVVPHTIPASPELVGRLLDNLLGNAARHGTAGGEVSVRWAPDGEESVLSVSNTAAPLNRETRERLHEPFVRGGGRVRADTGSGLGLAIATAVAQAHGGILRILGPDAGRLATGANPGEPAPASASASAPLRPRLSPRARSSRSRFDCRCVLLRLHWPHDR